MTTPVSLIYCQCIFIVYSDIMIFYIVQIQPSKSWIFKSRFLSKLGNNSLIFNRELFHFPPPCIISPTIPTINPFHYCSYFSPHYFTSPHDTYTISSILPTLSSSIWTFYLFIQLLLQFPPNIISPTAVFQPIQAARKTLWVREYCEKLHCFNLSLLPWSIDRNNSAHYYSSRIAQDKKIGVFQNVASKEDSCYQNRKTITPPSLISSDHCYYLLPY